MGQRRLFVFGLGYSATVLAHRLVEKGWRVDGTRRSEAAAPGDIATHRFERGHPLDDAGRAALAAATHLLSSVPPDEAGDPVLDAHGRDIAAHRGLAWVGYLSTTGVYGDSGGAWLDETAPLKPSSARGRHRVAAEAAWRKLAAQSVPVHIFRLAGIYGPGRNAIAQLRAGTAKRVDRPDILFSRIHVEDIASVLEASIKRPNPGAVYNVCDDRPAPSEAVVRHAAALIGVEPPPLTAFEDAGLSPMARSFYADNRKVSNARIKRELGVRLAYPDYEAGLEALARTER